MESKEMKELWKIKKEISKELYGKSWEEVDRFFKEASKKFRELDKNIEKEIINTSNSRS